MNIGNKTLAIIGITSILLFLFISLIVTQIVQNSFNQIEEDEATKSLERAKKILFLEVARLDMLASDWGEWDSTYYFVKGKYPDYPEVNLGTGSLENLHTNMMLFFNSSNQLLYGEAVDLDTGGSAEVSADLVEYIALQNEVLSYSVPDERVSGIINSPEGLLLVSFQPIKKNDYDGTIAGTLVLVRFLNPALIEKFEDTIDLSIEMIPFDKASTSNASYISTNKLSNDYLIASVLLDDVYGEPVLSLDVEIPRDVHDLGTSTAKYLYFIILLIALTYSIVLVIAIDRSVISRLSKLDNSINAIAVTGNNSSRIKIDGNDEITNLGNNINEMLRSLENKENLFEATIESNGDGIIVVDNDKKVIVMNSKFADMLDLPPDMRTGKDLYTILDHTLSRTNNADELNLKVRSILNTSDSNRDILHFKNTYYYEWYSSPFIKNGIINGRVFCLHDITEMKEIEGSLREANVVAETSNRTKSEFLANMSHELRTPLNSVIGFSEVLLEGNSGSLNEKQTRYLKNISKSGKHLLTIINDILDISKIESGNMHIHKENISVKNLLEDMFSSMQPLAAEKEIVMKVSFGPDLDYIQADKGKIKQVLYNLIGNALKFTEHGGSVTISAKVNGDMAYISVEDTGIGISRKDQEKLFKPFTQIDSSISRKYEGTGLGLALSKELVALHGGKIWVESEPGKGSTFTFTIPINGSQPSGNLV
ncbi:MAG: hybrid sensory histidine kinase BarA [Methanomethylovorans sp. PtaU1.Bin093]|jgi:PAS domain S-box-containing protein|uniref:ATP-binding protein n=1 Tax=Methanomethylovorans sp. PtaU1.Bin093 TaxID=1811679 RepID=UPI0009C9215A|nr:ATP-binding protein [Methanomethylovorans sp. PtaU1.Bin093]OPY20058.1 MAG: hybrid sensory histidine kinase BarA [Methanomethylovorans sp. PtaU1.Bin093]